MNRGHKAGSVETGSRGRSANPRTRDLRRSRRRRRGESGQSLIELVLVLPILLLVLFGILEFANAWRTYQVITNSGREGARYGVLPFSDSLTTVARVENRLTAGGLDPASANVQVELCPGGAAKPCPGDPARVDVTYPFQFRMIGPIAELICGNCGTNFGSVTLETTTVMRNE